MASGLVTGCSSSATVGSPSSPVASPQTPSFTPYQRLSGIPMSEASAITKVRTELDAFLALLTSKGYGAASEAYLVPGEQLTPQDSGPVLTSGRVTAFREDVWTSTGSLVVDVDLYLTFSGNSGAWGNGTNSRVVTATARMGAIPYVLEFATSR